MILETVLRTGTGERTLLDLSRRLPCLGLNENGQLQSSVMGGKEGTHLEETDADGAVVCYVGVVDASGLGRQEVRREEQERKGRSA